MARLVTTVGLALILISTAAADIPKEKPSANQSNDPKKYCLTFDDSTGSRVTRTECHTKAEWQQLGVDVDELVKK